MELYARTLHPAVGKRREGLSQPTTCAKTQAFPTDGANCKVSIHNDPKIILGSYVKRAQTISFVERGFEGLGLGH